MERFRGTPSPSGHTIFLHDLCSRQPLNTPDRNLGVGAAPTNLLVEVKMIDHVSATMGNRGHFIETRRTMRARWSRVARP
jgi:hypothetical protein